MSLRAWLLLSFVGCLLEVPSAVAAQATTYQTPHRPPRLMGDELSELERQRAELSLGGPIAWTIVGGVTALTGASVLLVGLLLESVPSGCEPTDGDYFGDDYCSEPDATPFLVIGTAGLVVGAVVLAVALPWMIDRIGERRALGLRIKELRRKRDGYGISDGPRLARAAPLLKLRF